MFELFPRRVRTAVLSRQKKLCYGHEDTHFYFWYHLKGGTQGFSHLKYFPPNPVVF